MLDAIRAFFDHKMHPANGGATNGNGGNGEAGDDGGAGNGNRSGRTAGTADTAAADAERQRLHVAACALLLELAHADDEFSMEERLHIEAVLRRHFNLDEDTAQELMELAEAERESAIDLYQFTTLIRSSYDLGQKTLLAEIMWGLILSDGQIARHEAYMLRKIANLLDLEPGYLSAARKRAAGDD